MNNTAESPTLNEPPAVQTVRRFVPGGDGNKPDPHDRNLKTVDPRPETGSATTDKDKEEQPETKQAKGSTPSDKSTQKEPKLEVSTNGTAVSKPTRKPPRKAPSEDRSELPFGQLGYSARKDIKVRLAKEKTHRMEQDETATINTIFDEALHIGLTQMEKRRAR